MGSLSRLIKEKGVELEGIKTEKIKVQQIHYTKLKESSLNFYTRTEEEVTELADTMLIAGGILQPLIVRKIDLSEYEILAGHKRKRASIYNVERGYKEYEFLPCIVIDMSGLMAKKISEKILAEKNDIEDEKLLDMIAEYIVICTNSTASENSSYEKMMQAVRLSKILPAMLDNEELKGRALRAEIAKEMKCSGGQVGRYQSIYNNLVPEALERFKDNAIAISVAYEMSGLDSDKQQEILKQQEITIDDIKLLKQKESRKTVSESDTESESLAAVNICEEMISDETVKCNDGYEHMEYDENNLNDALILIFDDESGISKAIKEELINSIKDNGGQVSILTDILAKALPFENESIKLERVFGYIIYFKNQKKKMSVALWPFWRNFIIKYKYGECVANKVAADVDEGDTQDCELAAVQDGDTTVINKTEAVQLYNIGYTQEDVRQIYDEQISIVQQFEYVMECGGLKDTESVLYKKAQIIRDGMTYLIKAFEEGTIC